MASPNLFSRIQLRRYPRLISRRTFIGPQETPVGRDAKSSMDCSHDQIIEFFLLPAPKIICVFLSNVYLRVAIAHPNTKATYRLPIMHNIYVAENKRQAISRTIDRNIIKNRLEAEQLVSSKISGNLSIICDSKTYSMHIQ